MARVIVPVRPGYEDGAMYLLQNRTVPVGGNVTINDSEIGRAVTQDLNDQAPTIVGEPWQIRIPTSMVILQDGAGALNRNGLPSDGDPAGTIGGGTSVLTAGTPPTNS